MKALRSILAATDFSVDGNNALRRAAALAREHGARLHVLHVLDPAGCRPLRDWFGPATDIELKSTQARDTLRRFAFEIAARHDVAARVELRVGEVLPTLLQAAARADLTVLGRRGGGRLGSLLLGSTAQRLLRTCRQPLLIVQQAAQTPYKTVLAPVDFTPAADAAVRGAALLARGGARIHVFHATDAYVESMLRRSDVDEDFVRRRRASEHAGAAARLRRKIARLGIDGRRTAFAVDRGPPVPATLRHAAAIGAELVVVGKQGGSMLGDWLLGGVAGRLAADCACDVLVVPRPRDAPRPAAASDTGAALPPPAADSLPPTAWWTDVRDPARPQAPA